jgi:nucleoside-diphosphate-sugar epimerase
MATIALLGATGSLGRAMGRLLGEAGRPYRAVSRSQMGLQVRFGDPLGEPVLWESEQLASILNALQGVETAVYLVGMPVWEFGKHLPLTRMVLDAAAQAGVRKLLLVSSNWSYGPPQAARLTESHPLAAHTAKGRIRSEQEELVLAAPGPLATAVLRIGDFYGPYVEASYLWSAFKAARNGAHAQLMSPADTPHEFVYVPDAAQTILNMIDAPQIWGHAWNLGGAGITTLRAMTEAIFTQARMPPNYEMPPPWKMRIVAMMNPYVRAMREMHYLLETPVLLDDSALDEALGGLKKTPYAEGIRQTLPTVRIGR